MFAKNSWLEPDNQDNNSTGEMETISSSANPRKSSFLSLLKERAANDSTTAPAGENLMEAVVQSKVEVKSLKDLVSQKVQEIHETRATQAPPEVQVEAKREEIVLQPVDSVSTKIEAIKTAAMTLEDITEAHIADLKAAGVVDFVKISALKNELKGLKEKMKNLDAKLNEKSSNLEDTAKKLQNILEIFEAIKNNNSEISTEIAQNLALAESDIKAEGERLNERKAILPEQLEEAKSDLKLKLEEAEQTFRNAQKAFSTEVLQNNLVFMSKIKAIQDRTETLGKSFDTEQVVEKYMKKIGSDKKEGFLKSLGVGEGDLKSFLTALSLKENPKPAIVNPVSETQEAA